MAVDDILTDAEVKRRVAALVRESLPETWQVTDSVELPGSTNRPGFAIEIGAVDGRRTRLVIDTKQVVERRDVARIGNQVRSLVAGTADVPVVGARYLSRSVREALTEQGLSYVDATGNMRVTSDAPAVFISSRGEDRDPWRKGRPKGTLKGEPAARVVRALLDYRRDWRVRDLIAVSGASTGATYRVLEYLQGEDLVAKSGPVFSVTDWERLLRQWSADAAIRDTTRVMTFIEPRGIDPFLARLTEESSPLSVAVTGSVAADEWAGYAPAKAVTVYVSSIHEASERWGLRSNATAPNVVLLEPATIGDVPFRNAGVSIAGYPIAAPAQVAADLLNGPGREPAEGEYLIEWMTANEGAWRRD